MFGGRAGARGERSDGSMQPARRAPAAERRSWSGSSNGLLGSSKSIKCNASSTRKSSTFKRAGSARREMRKFVLATGERTKTCLPSRPNPVLLLKEGCQLNAKTCPGYAR